MKINTIKYVPCFLLLALVIMPFAVATQTALAADVALVEPSKFQPIKASVTNDDPANYTINVKSISNLGVNEDAAVFAIYISSSAPPECADFTHLSLRYWKPGKYLRTFDLSDNPEVIDAIHAYQCVAVRNIPYNRGGR